MAKIAITTKTGDAGVTGLANGERLTKSSILFDAIGTLDELNSWLGLVAVKLSQPDQQHQAWIFGVQDTLFYVGAELAKSPKAKLLQAQVDGLEAYSQVLEELLKGEWHTQFVLPGGTEIGAHLDITRTVCRRCERIIVQYSQSESVSPIILKYINRLSDVLFLLRCYVNQQQQYQEKKFAVGKSSKK